MFRDAARLAKMVCNVKRIATFERAWLAVAVTASQVILAHRATTPF